MIMHWYSAQFLLLIIPLLHPFFKKYDLKKISQITNNVKINYLFSRHEARQIYTYIGDVCVSVNPYTNLDIYNMEYVNQYKGTDMST